MKSRRNLRTFLGSFVDAAKGFAEAVRTQYNIRFHFVGTVVALGMSYYYKLSWDEWSIIILAIAIVWLAELLNTAIEYIGDFVSPEYNHLIGKVKDISASASLIAAIASLTVGLIIFIPKIF
jgi:diacylglycerol kinase